MPGPGETQTKMHCHPPSPATATPSPRELAVWSTKRALNRWSWCSTVSSKSPWGGVEGFREEVMPWPTPTGWVGVCWCTGGIALRETQSQFPPSVPYFPPQFQYVVLCSVYRWVKLSKGYQVLRLQSERLGKQPLALILSLGLFTFCCACVPYMEKQIDSTWIGSRWDLRPAKQWWGRGWHKDEKTLR